MIPSLVCWFPRIWIDSRRNTLCVPEAPSVKPVPEAAVVSGSKTPLVVLAFNGVNAQTKRPRTQDQIQTGGNIRGSVFMIFPIRKGYATEGFLSSSYICLQINRLLDNILRSETARPSKCEKKTHPAVRWLTGLAVGGQR